MGRLYLNVKLKIISVIFIALFILIGSSLLKPVFATDAIKGIPYQGKLTNTNGTLVADGSTAFKFRIYDALSGGSCVYTAAGSCATPTAINIKVTNGIFNVHLGDTTAIYGTNGYDASLTMATLDVNKDLYLEVTVGSDTLAPRKRIGGAAFTVYSSLTNPTTDLSLSMGSNKTTFTYGNATSTNSLFTLTDTTSNSGTGNLLNVVSASSSAINPFRVNAAGTEALFVKSNGRVGIANTNPTALFSVGSSSQFQVNSSGAIAAATGIGSSGTIAFSGLSSDGLVKTTGGTGTLAIASGSDLPSGSTNYIQNTTSQQSSSNFNISGAGVIGTTLTISGLTSGSIPYAGTSGLISQNNSKLFWDNSNVMLGVGTNSLSATLHVVGQGGGNGNYFLKALGGAGGSTAGDVGDNALIQGGAGGANLSTQGVGGAVTIQGGTGGARISFPFSGAAGGRVNIYGGTGGGSQGSASGGDIYLAGGLPGGTTGVTGNVILAYNAGNLGNVGIGSTSPLTQLHVPGKSATIITTLGSGFVNPKSISIQGRYAYVGEGDTTGSQKLVVVDLTSMTILSTTNMTSAASNNPVLVSAKGKYLYTVDYNTGRFEIFDISNPFAPTSVSSITASFSTAQGLFVQDRYAYVVTASGTFSVVDVSDPANITTAGSLGSVNSGIAVYVQEKYAYVVRSGSNLLQIINVGTPSSPSSVTTIATGTGPRDIYVQDRYAYIINNGGSTFQVFSIADPSTPVQVTTSTGVATQTSPLALIVQDRYAYILNASTIQAFDLTTLSAPTSAYVSTTSLTNVGVFAVQGRIAYLTSSGAMQSYDIGGAYLQQLEAGGIESGTLALRNGLYANNGDFKGGLNIGRSLNVNDSALINGSLRTVGTVTLNSLTASKGVFTDASKNLTSTGTLGPTQGGTGFASYAVGDILYASTTSALSQLNDVATGSALISGGANTAPSWGKIGLTTHVSGTLGVGNGGTGATSLTGVLIGNGASAFTAVTTSVGISNALSDETGSGGVLVFSSSPSLTTPILANATSSTAGALGYATADNSFTFGNGTAANSFDPGAWIDYSGSTSVGNITTTPVVKYQRVGKLVNLYVSLIGTSTGAGVNVTFTIPAAISPAAVIDAPCRTIDNTTTTWGMVEINGGGSTTATVFTSPAASPAWAGTLNQTRSVKACVITYQAA
jgi:hypothetical protein